MEEFLVFQEELDRFIDMIDDWNLTEEDYYEAFSKMCLKYTEHSMIPYSVCNAIIDEEIPCEKYYMQMLMDVYSFFEVGENFLELLKKLLDEGYCDEYQKETHEIIKDSVKGGYVIAYRGEFATKDLNNLDYKESVSYSLDYDHAKFFATRFKMLSLTKSIVYTVKVPISDVLAYVERENEVICVPVCLGGKMEVVNKESLL